MGKSARLGIGLAGLVALTGLAAAAWWWWAAAHRPNDAELTLYGNVDLRQVELPFNGTERIAEVLVQEGDRVQRGQVLARLDTGRLAPQLAKAEADVAARQQVVDRLHHGNRPEEIAQAVATLEFQLGLDISWEPDLFGRARRAVEAADAGVEESVEDRHAALVALLGDVAQNYIELRGAQLSVSVAEQSVASIDELLQLTRARRAAGLVSDVDVVDAAAQLGLTRAQLPALRREIARTIDQLGHLLALEPEDLRAELAQAAPIAPLRTVVAIGLPADLARRRPDIRRAEASLHAATAEIGVAVAALFPRFSLGAGGGSQSETIGQLTQWASRFGAVGPTLDLPVFDLGRWRTVKVQQVRAKQAAVDYAAAVLNALYEVEDARAAYGAELERRDWLEATVDQNRDGFNLTLQRYSGGVASFIEVLDTQRTLQANQLSLAASRTALGDDLVRLYRALGGGWQP